MSADLLAEFGTNSLQADSSVSTREAPQDDSNDSFFDDEFDSFVSPEPASTNTPAFEKSNSNNVALTNNRVPQYVLDANTLPPVTQGAEVLFDASADVISDEDDEWGGFETAETAPEGPLLDTEDNGQELTTSIQNHQDQSVSNVSASVDLLSLDDKPSSNENTTSQISLSKKNTPKLREPILTRKNPSPQTRNPPKPSDDDFFGEWDDFEDGPKEKSRIDTSSSSPQLKQAAASQFTKELKVNSNMSTSSTKSRNLSQSQSVRPTNIPPPSLLLQVFSSLLENFREQLINSKREFTKSVHPLISDLGCTLRVASRIIAGRTLRWKRDTRLSQSMKIGPASSGKSSGMKLSSVSKGESIKEEQEVVGVIETWRHHASAFNSILQSSGNPPVPVITDKIRIISVTAEQGAIKAAHACALCGLKRDERLPKLDDDVQDSFGEWWIEHWGHTDCKWFWEEHSDKLHHR